MNFFKSTPEIILPVVERILSNTTQNDEVESESSVEQWKMALALLIPVTAAGLFMYCTSWPCNMFKSNHSNDDNGYQALKGNDSSTIEIRSNSI